MWLTDAYFSSPTTTRPTSALWPPILRLPGRDNRVEIIPEGDGVLTGVDLVGPDKMIVTYEQDASSHAYVYDRKGNRLSEIAFPTFGTAYFSTDKDSDEVYYSFTSFTYPSAIYRYDMATGESTR